MSKKAEAAEPLKLTLTPLADRIVVEPANDGDEQTFAGGKLVLPETAKEKPHKKGVHFEKEANRPSEEGHMHHGEPEGNEVKGKNEHSNQWKGDPGKKDGYDGMLHERVG